MKKFFLPVVIGMSLLVVSCKKESNTINPGDTPSKKLVQSTVNPTTHITYNPDGTPKEITFQNTSGAVSKKIFSYAAGKCSYIWIAAGKKAETAEYTIVNGKPTALDWTSYNANEEPVNTFHESFTYKTKGLMNKHIYKNGNYSQYTYDGNDNLVQAAYYDEQGSPIDKTEYTYGNQKDLFPMFNYFQCWGDGFTMVPFAKYLPVTSKATDLVSQQVTSEGTFTYELDAAGYVIKGKWHKVSGNVSDWEWTNVFQ